MGGNNCGVSIGDGGSKASTGLWRRWLQLAFAHAIPDIYSISNLDSLSYSHNLSYFDTQADFDSISDNYAFAYWGTGNRADRRSCDGTDCLSSGRNRNSLEKNCQ